MMPTRREFIGLLAAGSAAFVSGKVAALGQDAKTRRPNILFLMTDQHRADCLGCYGNSIIKTPNFDRLAREGMRFVHAYSSVPTCTPARTGLLTGLSPWHHGMLGYGQVADRYPLELQRALHDAGYYTFAVGKLHYFPQRNLHGFDGALLDESGRVETEDFVDDYRQWFKAEAPDLDPDATGIGWNNYRARAYVLPEELHPTHWTGETAADFIRKYNRPEPFLLMVSFARPHSPYDPPSRFMRMYNEADMPLPYVGKWAEKYAPVERRPDYDIWHGDPGPAQVRRSRRGYYGAVSFIDEQIGRIIRALEKRGMLENTLILFTSDHGDMTGDHHFWRKAYPYESSAGIPMLIRWPRTMGMENHRGKELTQPVELRDVFPTFLDAAGEAIPQSLDGRSMLPLIRGETEGWRPYIDLEHDVCYSGEIHWNALTDGRWKYIYHALNGSQQLFDLKNDPGELNDLASDPGCARTLKAWRHRLIEHLSERGEEFVKDGDLVPRPQRMLYSPNYPKKA